MGPLRIWEGEPLAGRPQGGRCRKRDLGQTPWADGSGMGWSRHTGNGGSIDLPLPKALILGGLTAQGQARARKPSFYTPSPRLAGWASSYLLEEAEGLLGGSGGQDGVAAPGAWP